MDEFFQINEISNKHLESLKNFNRFSEETRLQKVKYLSDLKKRLKNILKTNKDLQNEAVGNQHRAQHSYRQHQMTSWSE